MLVEEDVYKSPPAFTADFILRTVSRLRLSFLVFDMVVVPSVWLLFLSDPDLNPLSLLSLTLSIPFSFLLHFRNLFRDLSLHVPALTYTGVFVQN